MSIEEVEKGLTTPEIRIPEQRRGGIRGLFRAKAIGVPAVESAVDTVIDLVAAEASAESGNNDNEALFGLEDDFIEYGQLWREHDGAHAAFVKDPTNAENLRTVLSQVIMGGAQNRKERRLATRWQGEDLGRLAVVGRLAGKIHAYYAPGRIFKGLRVDSIDELRSYKTAESRRTGLLSENNVEQTEPVLMLSANLESLVQASRRTYSEILRHENKINDKVLKQIHQNPEKGIEFLDTVLSLADSEAEVDRLFLTHFANDYVMHGDESVLGQALGALHEHSERGGLVAAFLREKLTENAGDNLLAFMARALSHSPDTQGFTDFMIRERHNWPQDLTQECGEFIRDYKLEYTMDIDKVISKAIRKDRLHPDMNLYAQIVDQAWARMFPRTIQGMAAAKPGQVDNQIAREVNAQVPAEVIERRTLPVGVVVPNGIGMKIDTDREDVVEKFIGKRAQDAQLVADLKAVITKLQDDPYGSEGVTSLNECRVNIGGKKFNIYRLNPDHLRAADLTISPRAKLTRVLFTVANGTLGIISIAKNHQDYEQTVYRLSRPN